MEFEIRLAEKRDYQQLLSLLKQLNPSDPDFSNIEADIFEEILLSKYLDLIVADKNGELLGSCYLNILPNLTRSGRPYSVIENVITDSAHRNQGIGKAILNYAADRSWAENCYKVMLMSGRKEAAVHSFYKKCGFDGNQKQAYVRRSH